jgi:uncharacterized spore protein YtfJ
MTTVQDVLDRASVSARDVFGEPYEKDGVVVIPVARMSAGAGSGGAGISTSSGQGWGFKVEPAGAFVIKNGNALWRPATNVNRIVTGAFVVGAIAVWRGPKVFKSLGKLFR